MTSHIASQVIDSMLPLKTVPKVNVYVTGRSGAQVTVGEPSTVPGEPKEYKHRVKISLDANIYWADAAQLSTFFSLLSDRLKEMK